MLFSYHFEWDYVWRGQCRQLFNISRGGWGGTLQLDMIHGFWKW